MDPSTDGTGMGDTGMGDLGLDAGLWMPAAPAPVMPVPAAQAGPLRGRRVVTGGAAHGWRYDLRADDAVERDGRQLVPVLAEYEYYRAELDHVEVFAPLVPAGQVWVERIAAGTAEPAAGAENLLARLVTLDTPPVRHPVPAREIADITGRRVVVVSPSRERRDLRATSQFYENGDHTICIRVCPEPDWYRWAFTGAPARSVEVPVYLVWAE